MWEYREVPNLDDRGNIDSPNIKGKEVRIRSTLKDEEKLEVIIHELLHGCGWWLDEEWIEMTALDVSRILWRLGYRDEK